MSVVLHTKDRILLCILGLGAFSKHGPEIVVIDCFFICHHPVPPLLLPCFALHLILIDRLCGVEIRKFFLKMFVYVVVHFSQFQLRAAHLFQDRPVRCHMLNS